MSSHVGNTAPPGRQNLLTGTERTHTSPTNSHVSNTAPPDRENLLTDTGRATLDGQQEVLFHFDGTDFTSQLQPLNM